MYKDSVAFHTDCNNTELYWMISLEIMIITMISTTTTTARTMMVIVIMTVVIIMIMMVIMIDKAAVHERRYGVLVRTR